MFTKSYHWILSWAKLIQFTTQNLFVWCPFEYKHPVNNCVANGLFHSSFQSEISYKFHTSCMPLQADLVHICSESQICYSRLKHKSLHVIRNDTILEAKLLLFSKLIKQSESRKPLDFYPCPLFLQWSPVTATRHITIFSNLIQHRN